MSLKRTNDMLNAAENVERDLYAARTGERLTFTKIDSANVCGNCWELLAAHVRESGILFCPDNALREVWGR